MRAIALGMFSVGGWVGVALATCIGVPFVWALVVWIWCLTVLFVWAVWLYVRR